MRMPFVMKLDAPFPFLQMTDDLVVAGVGWRVSVAAGVESIQAAPADLDEHLEVFLARFVDVALEHEQRLACVNSFVEERQAREMEHRELVERNQVVAGGIRPDPGEDRPEIPQARVIARERRHPSNELLVHWRPFL